MPKQSMETQIAKLIEMVEELREEVEEIRDRVEMIATKSDDDRIGSLFRDIQEIKERLPRKRP